MLLYRILGVLLFTITGMCQAQQVPQAAKNSVVRTFVNQDTMKAIQDKIPMIITSRVKDLAGKIRDLSPTGTDIPGSSFSALHLKTKPLLKFNGGFISYNLDYRSNIDTPFFEQNIWQHNIYGNSNVSIAGIPIKVDYLIRRSNSNLFRNINDVQVELDVLRLGDNVRSVLKDRLLAMVPNLSDSLAVLNYKTYAQKLGSLTDHLKSPAILQKLAEYKEILDIPGIAADSKLTDSLNTGKINELQKEARAFINEYNESKLQREVLKKKVDSLEDKYNKGITKIQAYKTLINQKLNSANSYEDLANELKAYDIYNLIPRKYAWLLNVKKFGVGKSQLNYSELTSKNMSLTGVNFEYNSWYYASFSAGTVDYRFRDFSLNRKNGKPQYMVLARLGIGKTQGSHLIFSTYRGRKQLFAVTNSNSAPASIDITGIAVEGRYNINRNIYMQIELATSISPDFRTNPASTTKLNFADRSNKAIATKFYSYFPKTGSRIEAMYKYTGMNFQSFSSFQTNAATKAWYIKSDQVFFKRKLKISASVKTKEFTNPYIIQNYSSNTVFKTVQVTFRTKRFPLITAGYSPTSQITSVDGQFVESSFYSFNGAITHTYRIGEKSASSVLIYNNFQNSEKDTGFLYYKAKNIFFSQTVLFSLYTMNFSVSHSRSSSFELNVLDAGLQYKFNKNINLNIGMKVNEFDRAISKTGLYGGVQMSLKQIGTISLFYDKGYIPASNHQLVKNTMMNFNLLHTF